LYFWKAAARLPHAKEPLSRLDNAKRQGTSHSGRTFTRIKIVARFQRRLG
jgi:hypothetical protein